MRFLERALAISDREAELAYRGFEGATREVEERLEGIGSALIAGYRLAVSANRDLETLAEDLRSFPAGQRGFAYEGAAMGLVLLDALLPRKPDRFDRFIACSTGQHHVYMSFVGAGLAIARLPWKGFRGLLARHPLLGWLAVDGWGFHHGFFKTRRAVRQRLRPLLPKPMPGFSKRYSRRAFDQGLGRSLWFAEVCDPDRVGRTVADYEESRRSDLWSGIGLAACYVGVQGEGHCDKLQAFAGKYRADLAQGAVFAAAARNRAGFVPACSADTCHALTGISVAAAAELADWAEEHSEASASVPAYESWRHQIRVGLARNKS